MSDRLLTSIIELEKALQEEVRREELRAAAWHEREQAELTAAVETARRELVAWHDEQLAAASREAAAESANLRAAALARCARLAELPESFLERILRRQFDTLMPEAGDDHPHGQG